MSSMLVNGRGSTYAWRKRRVMVFERAQGRCRLCQKRTPLEAGDADHIVRREVGGDDGLANLRWLCRPCHRGLSSRFSGNAFRHARWSVRSPSPRPSTPRRTGRGPLLVRGRP